MKKTLLPWIVAAASLTVIGMHDAVIRPWMPDDAFISFRYAESLTAGNGIVFNPGERTEGYTSFLWVILLALGHLIGFDTVLFAKLLSAAFSLATVLLLLNAHRFARSVDRDISLMAVLMLGSCGVFTPWARSGMEVTLFTFLILLTTLVYLSISSEASPGEELRMGTPVPIGTCIPSGSSVKGTPESARRAGWRLAALGVLCAVSTLARPEGCLVLAVIVIYDILRSSNTTATDGAVSKLVRSAYLIGPFLAVYLPYFVWRYSYYGYLLPNTFYAKVGFHLRQILRGIRYGMGFATVAAFILVPIVVWAFSWQRSVETSGQKAAPDPPSHERLGKSRDRNSASRGRDLGLLVLLVSVYSLYVIAVGGDVLAAYRFFAAIMPVMCLASAICATLVFRKRNLAPFVLAVFIYNLIQLNVGYGIHLHLVNDRVAMEGKEVGLWLRDHAAPASVIAVNAAGSIPYYSRLRTIDMLGLNDVHIAHREVPRFGGGMPGHEKGDGAYVLALAPTYIQFGASLGSKEPAFLGDKEISADPRFRQHYVMQTHSLPSGRQFTIYKRIEARSGGTDTLTPTPARCQSGGLEVGRNSLPLIRASVERVKEAGSDTPGTKASGARLPFSRGPVRAGCVDA